MKNTYRKESVGTDTKAPIEGCFTWQQFLRKSSTTAIAGAPKTLFQVATWARDRGVIEKLACLSWQHFSSGTKQQTLMGSFYSHGVKSCICCTIFFFFFAIFRIVTPIWTERTKQQLMLLVWISSSCFFFFFWRLWIGMLLVVNVFVFLQQRVAASCTTTKWLLPLC